MKELKRSEILADALPYTGPTIRRATTLLNACQAIFGVERADLYLDDTNKRKWTVVLRGPGKTILPFWTRLRIAFQNIRAYKKISSIVPNVIISIGFVPPKNSTGKNMLAELNPYQNGGQGFSNEWGKDKGVDEDNKKMVVD